jgi:uncharacterized protein
MNQSIDYNKTVLERYVAALQAADADALRSFFAQDASWTLQAGDLPISGTWRGRDRIMDGFFATAMTNYEPDSVEIEVTAMIAEGDRVVLQWTSRARTRDGRPYENGCLGIFTVRDGKIQAVREYMDTRYAGAAFSRARAAA